MADNYVFILFCSVKMKEKDTEGQRQLELSHSSIPSPKGGTFCTWSSNTKDN